MVAYTRQSTLTDGDTITAALFNNEYNQLLSAFSYASSGTTGHKHDGTAGEGGHVPQIGDQDFLNKIVTDSTNNRFGIFVQVSSSAVEQIRIQDGAIVPVTDNDIDLGTSSVEFKNAYFDGTVTTDALVADTADINGGTVDGATIGASSATTGVFTTIQGSTITATTAFVPDASDGAALGTSSLEFSDLFLADEAVINFGDDQDVTLTHVADTGLLLNSTNQLQFNDSSQFINAPSATVLDINATDEIELNATLVDVNANLDVSGTYTGAGLMTTGGSIVIPDGGNIGSASDTDAMAIASNGVVTFSQNPVFPDGGVPLADLDIDGATDIGAALANGDLFIVDDGAGGTNRKTEASRIKTYIADVTLTTAAQTNITSLGTLTALTVDDVGVDGKVITMTGSTDDTATLTVGTNGTLTIETVDTAAAAANIQVTADGTFEVDATTITLDSSGDIVLDADGGDVFFKDAGTTFGSATNTSGNLIIKSGTTTALTFSGANVTAAGTYTGGGLMTTGGNIVIPDAGNIGSASDTDAIAISSAGLVTISQDLTVSDDVTIGDDLLLDSDAAVIKFGDDQDVTLTHVADTGLLLNSTMQLQFNDASQNINAPSATVLDINATDEIELNATLVDVNANLDVSGTYTGAGLMTTGGNIVIPDAGNIGSASDTDAIAIASNGVVTFSQVPVLPNDTIETADIQDNAVTLAKMAGLARGKVIVGDSNGDPSVIGPGSNGQALISDGTDIAFTDIASSSAADDITTGDAAVTIATSSGDITIDAQGNDTDIILKGTDGGADKTAINIDMSENALIKFPNDSQALSFGADGDVTITHVADTGVTLSAGDNDTTFEVVANISDGTVGPFIKLKQTTASSAANDLGGQIVFEMESNSDTQFIAGSVHPKATTITDGSEVSNLIFQTSVSGAPADALILGTPTNNGTSFRINGTMTDDQGFAQNTAMAFFQASAPTGWTKSTDHNDKALRVVSGTGGNTGGSVAFETAFASQSVAGNVSTSVTVGNKTLSINQIPAHSHSVRGNIVQSGNAAFSAGASAGTNTANAGGSGAHNHTGNASSSFSGTAIDLDVQYLDVIICLKGA
jgi:hypothetical protein